MDHGKCVEGVLKKSFNPSDDLNPFEILMIIIFIIIIIFIVIEIIAYYRKQEKVFF